MMEVKVVSDTKNSQGQNFGIFRQENSYTVIAKSYRLEEFGINNGQRINFKAKIKLDFPRFDNEIEFGSRLIVKGKIEKYNFQNIPYSLAVENYSVLKKASIFNKSINKVRENFLTVSNNVSGNAKQLLPGLILGDTRNQTLALSQDMKNSGLTHLTAVSGGNIAILLLVIIWLSQKLKFTFKYQITIGLITLVLFAFLVRAEPSVIRASTMGAISLLGLFSGTRRHGISALAIAVCIALLIDPFLSSSWGFSLSVFATAGLLLFTRSFVDSITRIFPRIPESLAVLIAVALSAQLSTASLIAAFSGQITLMSIPANLLAAPAIPFVTILGYLTLLFSNLFMPLAKLFGYAAAFLPTGLVF
jgi:competence protein ComEC